MSNSFANNFYSSTYHEYWSKKRPCNYILTEYDTFLLSLIPSSKKLCLEACIGNAIPFSRHLSLQGHSIHGFDISESLVSQANTISPQINAIQADIHSYSSSLAYDLIFIFHSLHMVPEPYLALNSLINNTPNARSYLIEFPSIYNAYNSSHFYKRELLFASQFNRHTFHRMLKNTLKRILRVGHVDNAVMNLYEPLCLTRVLEIIPSASIYGIKLSPFLAAPISPPFNIYDLVGFDRFVLSVEVSK